MNQEKQGDRPLRHGYTTGANATAAAKGALLALIRQQPILQSRIWLPAGFYHTFALLDCQFDEQQGQCSIIKDGGDDPDATHLLHIIATVSWQEQSGVHIDGGVGVGRITKPGLPIAVGEAAINPVPRRMIATEIRHVLEQHGLDRGVKVVITVPEGERVAQRTLNGRLGIVGGVSILGTRGIVVPFCTAAYKTSIVRALQVAAASGCRHVVLTTGGRSEKYAMQQLPALSTEAFIEMGDFVGFSLRHAKRLGLQKVTLAGMMGKFSKIAQGVMMVHAHSASIDFNYLAHLAALSGGSDALQTQIRTANTASQASQFVQAEGLEQFHHLLCLHACEHALEHVKGGIGVEVLLFTLDGQPLGRAELNG